MGQSLASSVLKKIKKLDTEELVFNSQIGKGGFSTVFKATVRSENAVVAVKVLSKSKIIDLKMTSEVSLEKKILSSLYSNFISNLYCAFQDKKNLYLITDYFPSPDLRSFMSNNTDFSEAQIKFIASNCVIGWDYIHSNNYIHRDIKPENWMFDEKGYLRIIDFGISQEIGVNNNGVALGTCGYMSPEMVNYKRWGPESDYFALGVVWYELVTQSMPFKETDQKKIRDEFNSNKELVSFPDNISELYSQELLDFIRALLVIDNTQRLGYNGVEEIQNHKLFKGFNWRHATYKILKSPLKGLQFDGNKEVKYKGVNNKIIINADEKEKESNTPVEHQDFDNFNFKRRFFGTNIVIKSHVPKQTFSLYQDSQESRNKAQTRKNSWIPYNKIFKPTPKPERQKYENSVDNSLKKTIFLPWINQKQRSINKWNISISDKLQKNRNNYYNKGYFKLCFDKAKKPIKMLHSIKSKMWSNQSTLASTGF